MSSGNTSSSFRDISALGVMSVSLTAAFVFTLLAIILGATDAYLPAAWGMWHLALGLFVFAIVGEVLRCTGLLAGWPITAIHSIASVAVPVTLFVGVASHSDFLAAKMEEARCTAERSSGIERASKKQANARAALNRCHQEFEAKKTIFNSETVEARCRSLQRTLDAALADKRANEQTVCSTASARTAVTGSQPAPK